MVCISNKAKRLRQ